MLHAHQFTVIIIKWVPVVINTGGVKDKEVNMDKAFNVFGFHRANLEKLINEHWQEEFNSFNEKFYLPKGNSLEEEFDFSTDLGFGYFMKAAELQVDWKEHPFYLLVCLQHSIVFY